MMQSHVRSRALDHLGVDVALGPVDVDHVARRPRNEQGRALVGRLRVERVDVEIRVARDATGRGPPAARGTVAATRAPRAGFRR